MNRLGFHTGLGRVFFQSVLVALASSRRPVLVLNYPRESTVGFWRTVAKTWDAGDVVEREVWRQVVACGEIPFFWRHDTAHTLFWSEASDAHLARCSPWFERHRGGK